MTEQNAIHCQIINQIFAIEAKVDANNSSSLKRKFSRINELFEELGIGIHNPLNEDYNETRLDCEATILGDETEELIITEVIKPIVHHKSSQGTEIIQRGVVLVSKKQ